MAFQIFSSGILSLAIPLFFLLLGHPLPDLVCLLGNIHDTDAEMGRLDLFSSSIEPQHVCRHVPFGGIEDFALLHLHRLLETIVILDCFSCFELFSLRLIPITVTIITGRAGWQRRYC